MKKHNIIEIENKYINIDTEKEASAKEIKAFKKRVQLYNQKTEEKIKNKNYIKNTFMDSRRKHIIDLLGLEEIEFEELRSNHDVDYLVYMFSTSLFDRFLGKGRNKWLEDVKIHMGKKFYYNVIEGYVLGNHDT